MRSGPAVNRSTRRTVAAWEMSTLSNILLDLLRVIHSLSSFHALSYQHKSVVGRVIFRSLQDQRLPYASCRSRETFCGHLQNNCRAITMLLRFPLRKPVLFHNLQPCFTARQEDDLERLRRFHRRLIKCIIRQVHHSINFFLFPPNRD